MDELESKFRNDIKTATKKICSFRKKENNKMSQEMKDVSREQRSMTNGAPKHKQTNEEKRGKENRTTLVEHTP